MSTEKKKGDHCLLYIMICLIPVLYNDDNFPTKDNVGFEGHAANTSSAIFLEQLQQ